MHILLNAEMFAEGQGYVALSRVRRLSQVHFWCDPHAAAPPAPCHHAAPRPIRRAAPRVRTPAPPPPRCIRATATPRPRRAPPSAPSTSAALSARVSPCTPVAATTARRPPRRCTSGVERGDDQLPVDGPQVLRVHERPVCAAELRMRAKPQRRLWATARAQRRHAPLRPRRTRTRTTAVERTPQPRTAPAPPRLQTSVTFPNQRHALVRSEPHP